MVIHRNLLHVLIRYKDKSHFLVKIQTEIDFPDNKIDVDKTVWLIIRPIILLIVSDLFYNIIALDEK